jgi:acetylornithine aminotransferase
MMAFDVAPQYQGLMLEGLKQRVVLNVTGNNSIRLLPPYTLSDEEADQLIERVAKTVLEAPAAE